MVGRDNSDIEVQFCVNIGNNNCVHEREFEHNFDRHREILLARTDHEGAIIISAPGQPEVYIEDDLQIAIPSICFASIPQLLTGKPYVHSYFSMYGTISFEPVDKNVKISGDYIPDINVSNERLLDQLYHCGLRFIDYFNRLRGDEWHEIIDELWVEAEIAKRVLFPA